MKLRHFSIRDLLWLTALCAVLVAWWIDLGKLADVIERFEKRRMPMMAQSFYIPPNPGPPNFQLNRRSAK